MTPEIEALRNDLKAQSLEYLRRNTLPDENDRRRCIWRFAEKLTNASPVAKARFVNEVFAESKMSLQQ